MRTEPLTCGATVEVDLDALLANYRLLRNLAPDAETAAVVKCDAYGLGAAPVGQALAGAGCRSFFVTYPEEGARLRAAIGGAAAIYVFNGPDPRSLGLFARAGLIPIVNSLDQARLWRRDGRGAPAALHLDTGINRLGAPAAHHAAIAVEIDAPVLVMSHLACSSDPGHAENRRQLDAFVAAAARWPRARRSLAASAGAMMGRDYQFDMTRIGAALYGVSPFDAPDDRLAPTARLTAQVLQVFDASAGDGVGYSRISVLTRASRLATLAFGYGDGLHRAASLRAEVLLGGVRCPVLGRVSMDLAVVDVTDAGKVSPGDRAEIFGPGLPVHEAAAAMQTIGYEVLTSLGPRVARLYSGGAPSVVRDGDLAVTGRFA